MALKITRRAFIATGAATIVFSRTDLRVDADVAKSHCCGIGQVVCHKKGTHKVIETN